MHHLEDGTKPSQSTNTTTCEPRTKHGGPKTKPKTPTGTCGRPWNGPSPGSPAEKARRVPYRGITPNQQWLTTRTAAINLRRLINLGLDQGTSRLGPQPRLEPQNRDAAPKEPRYRHQPTQNTHPRSPNQPHHTQHHQLAEPDNQQAPSVPDSLVSLPYAARICRSVSVSSGSSVWRSSGGRKAVVIGAG